jgi:hypothetical protein
MEAKNLLQNKLLPELFSELEKNQLSAWLFAENAEKREQLWTLARAINTVREHIDERAKHYAREGSTD